MSEWLGPHESLLRDSIPDFWRRVAAFWGAAYTVLHGQAMAHPEWQTVLYEDLCLEPAEHFGRLFTELGLKPTRSTSRIIDTSTTQRDEHAKSTRRDSRSMVDVWRRRLTEDQIRTVCSVVAEFNLPYYRSENEIE